MPRHRLPSLLVLVSILAITTACATNSPVSLSCVPGSDLTPREASYGNHHLWGTWEVRVDLENGVIESVPLRSADLHFNVVPLLKEGTPNSCLKFANLLVDSPNHTLQVDISLVHPFPDFAQTAGFDVRGILFTRGDALHLGAADVTMTGPDEPRLVNADGYTRWWNPVEFPTPGLLGYIDGLYGTNNSSAGYLNTIAGYKCFADSLNTIDTLDKLGADDRAVFRAGSTNTRRYLIDFGDIAGNYLVFNYAVDANWVSIPGWEPSMGPPIVPDDFPFTANCPEPYRIKVIEKSNTLSATSIAGTSGMVQIDIEVFDWQVMDPISTVPMEVSIVQVEAPIFGLGPVTATVVPGSGAGGHSSTYTASIAGACPDKYDTVDLIVTATSSEGDYQQDITGFLGVDPLQAFFLYAADVVDNEIYTGWIHRYTKLLMGEQPNQGENLPDIAVYKKNGFIYAATIDQINADPNGDGGHNPDSVNVWRNDYKIYSKPEYYHMPTSMLSGTGLWDDIRGISINDSANTLLFSNTNIHDEYATGETDPLYAYITWVSHEYLGDAPATNWETAFFSAGDYPRYFATDPSNGVKIGNDFMYTVFLYDVTGMAGANPAADPQRYIIFRWAPPYDLEAASVKWQRPLNVPPNGEGTGYVDRDYPYDHRLAVDDQPALDRFYILDSHKEIEVVDCDFTADEFSGSTSVGTVIIDEWPVDCTDIIDIEVVRTIELGEPRNYVAALVSYGSTWGLWVFDFDSSQPVGSQASNVWLSDQIVGIPCSLDAVNDPIEVHVLHQNGGLINVSVFRDYP